MLQGLGDSLIMGYYLPTRGVVHLAYDSLTEVSHVLVL